MQNHIRDIRKQQRVSLAALEAATGISAQHLNRLEKGERRLNTDNILVIAKALNRRPEDIIACGTRIPVIGTVGAGAEVFPIDDIPLLPQDLEMHEQDYINCQWIEAPPGSVGGTVVALRVVGNSMWPLLKEGAIIYYSDRFMGGASENCIDRLCVVQRHDGATFVKEVQRSQKHGCFDLISYNQPPMRDVRLAWCAPVTFIKP